MSGLRLLVLLLAAALALRSPTASAASASRTVFIWGSEVDLRTGRMTVYGENFGSSFPLAMFDGVPLPVLSRTEDEIVLRLPPRTVPGRYVLELFQGPLMTESSSLEIRIGSPAP